MEPYRSIVVGSDGSETSRRAVDRAARLARDSGATLVIVCAYHPAARDERAEDALGDEAFLIRGSAPAEQKLQLAADRAAAAGAPQVHTAAVMGEPVDVLRKAAAEHGAQLIVVGNVGLNTLHDRLLGSVPSNVARRSGVDVLIVHTT
jgi:nucleotide-binding universal stress UspA family protein